MIILKNIILISPFWGWLFIAIIITLAILVSIDIRLRVKNKIELLQQKQRIAEITSGVMGHNQMLIDGLEYAKYIQEALMPDENTLSSFFKDILLLNFPKTIVSGDFYWVKSFSKTKYLIIADSTGHGIPGGFMSMLGMAYLNQILISDKILPNEILEQLRMRIKESLKQHNIDQNNDSIDMFCCRMNLDLNELSYAAANIPGYVLTDGKIIELPAQKTTLGFNLRTVNFENVTVPMKTGDRLFLFTDGFPDQFNQQGERFTRRNLLQIIESNQKHHISEIKKVISDAFLNWKTDTAQTDDALLVSVEL